MDETPTEQITYLFCQVAEFYHGAVGYRELQEMPLSEVYELYKNALKIQDEAERNARK